MLKNMNNDDEWLWVYPKHYNNYQVGVGTQKKTFPECSRMFQNIPGHPPEHVPKCWNTWKQDVVSSNGH